MSSVFIGDEGTEIVLDCGITTTTATVRSILARKSNGVLVTWSAVQDGTSSIKHTTSSGDLDVAGEWKLQAYVEMPGWKGKGAVAKLTVNNPV